MEHRQHVEDLVLAAEVDAGARLGGVRQHVAVGQDHALGRALRARGEQDGGPVVGLARHQRGTGAHHAANLVEERDGGADVLQIDDRHLLGDRRHHVVEPALLHEHPRGQDGGDLGGLAGRQDVGGAGREVDHRRHPAGRQEAEEGHHRAVGIGQHQADGAAFRRVAHQLVAQDGGAHQQLAVAERPAHRILDRDAAAAVILGGLQQRLKHGAVRGGGAEHQVRHDAVERGAGRLAAGAALEGGIDRELDRLEHRDLDLGEPAPAHLAARQPAERRLLQPFDAHRHHLGIGLVGDQRGAVIDLHQAAGDGDAALRKDDQRLAAP